jgi:hypothetical protein
VSFLFVNPDAVAAAAPNLANIGTTISDANAAAAASTTELLPAALDEISAAIAGLFGTYAQDYHTLTTQAAGFHERFVQALSAGAGSYVAAEGANLAALSHTAPHDLLGVIRAPAATLLGRPLVGTGSRTPSAATNVLIDAAGPIPENAYPFGSVKQLTFVNSINTGLPILDSAIQQQLAQGNTVTVYGYSQSALVASLEMAKLQAEGVPTGPNSPVSFKIFGNPMNPNGGFFERFAGLQMPSLGIDFYGATPSNLYPTKMYTIEYDGFADFPQYPLNFLADANALASLNHFYYHVLTADQINNAIPLATSGPTTTQYYMIPATQLPLLNSVRGLPVIGNPISDLLQPDLTYLVNMGYGDPRYGWSTGPANVPTQAGLLPPASAFQMLPGLLASGAQQGMHDFVGDFTGTGPNPVALPTISSLTSLLSNPSSLTSSLTSLYAPASGAASGTVAATGPLSGLPAPLAQLLAIPSDPAALGAVVANLPNTLSKLAADVYTIGLPTADILNAAVVSVPGYDINLFFNGLLQAVNGQPVQGLINAFGQPIASDVGLYLWLANLEAAVIGNPSEAAGPNTGVPAIGIN